ncbi:serine/threonine-protein kinase TAO1-like [Anneissia japonica]|uniref:serine/threonine-protein kinase TAO1-like n=1 Tax=Anneissia japonica TaxID=1529436 RepID=UPI0014255245|nr:serine/threonine-protein kinase TAO1-like [Anneissia japonica]XP_033112180.1 serine/threonine-protein kinase TAO1-like [Anneissia japonica]
MPLPSSVANIKDPEISSLFSNEDPEKLFDELREIGHGSFGAVYYARNVKTNEVVAIKKMSYNGKNSTEKWQDIIKEVTFLRQLKHNHCIEYKGCYLREHTAWLSMEYCLGSASDILEVHRMPLQEDEIAAIAEDALKGLSHLHRHNKIHRDVKAGNILLTDNGTVKLADFGSASFVSPANSFVGTPYWMAPEVILAMDEGQYEGKVDIWSLGITCIELAERKPPLFNMNAMSALYHIAQNDPPTLSSETWSHEFRNFVERCLAKDPEQRPSAEQLLRHPFIIRDRNNNVICELIERTKTAVRESDNLNYRKMLKLVMTPSIAPSPKDENSEEESDSQEEAPQTGSVSSQQSLPESFKNSSKNSSVTSIPGEPAPEEPMPPTVQPTMNTSNSTNNVAKSKHLERDEHFKTIRTTTLVNKQANEHKQNELRVQFQGYKELRKQHRKQLQMLESRLRQEMSELKQRLDKEFEQFIQCNAKDMEKLMSKHTSDKDRKNRMSITDEKKLMKGLQQNQDRDRKAFSDQLRKDYKSNKQQFKRNMDNTPKRELEAKLRDHKEKLLSEQKEAEGCLLEQQKQAQRLELRMYQRRQLRIRHTLEQDQLREELNKKQVVQEMEHVMLQRHHELTQDLEYRHIHHIQSLRTEQMQKQFHTELTNQHEYERQAERELRKKHGMEMKQQPKNLKAKEQSIKKQFHEACKTQSKQYKALRGQTLANTPKEQQKAVEKKLKEEERRKMAILGDQYSQSIAEMLQSQSLKLDESQEREAQDLKQDLQKELELLSAYQSKTRKQLETQHAKELHELEEKVSLRRVMLQQRIEEETVRLQADKSERIRRRLEAQGSEMTMFDEESLRLGFSAMSVEEMKSQDGTTDGVKPSPSRNSMQWLDSSYSANSLNTALL